MAGTASLPSLSKAHILLLAINFTSASDLQSLVGLRNLHPTVLTPAATLTILLFLPESLQPSTYLYIIDSILNGLDASSISASDGSPGKPEVDTSSISDLSDKIAASKVDRLLASVSKLSNVAAEETPLGRQELVAEWLQLRSKAIDTETGMLSSVESLLVPFLGRLPKVDAYYNGTVKVLSRMIYEYDRVVQDLNKEESECDWPKKPFIRGLAQFEALPVSTGVKQLLSKTSYNTVFRDLNTLIIPYLQNQESKSKLQGWRVVWEWLVSQDLRTNYEVFMNWGGPLGYGEAESLSVLDYARTGMAACYLCEDIGLDSWEMMSKIQKRIVDTLGPQHLRLGISQQPFNRELYTGGLRAKPAISDLLSADNKLTTPTIESLDLLGYMITAARLLSAALYSTVHIRLSGTKEAQDTLLIRYIRSGNWVKRTDQEWHSIIEAARWMRATAGVFEQLTEQDCEEVLVKSLLSAAKFKLVEDIYVKNSTYRTALGMKTFERAVLDAFQEFYDNASNGNMTRGGMKNAQFALQILYPTQLRSQSLLRASRLLNATHALSFYSLTLTPGVPLLPVQIRISPDPVSLIGRVLDQNASLYLQPDKLVPLAKDLHFGTGSTKSRSVIDERNAEEEVERRVLGMCIETALAEDDFDTAYSLTKSRLRTPEGNSKLQRDGSGDQNDDSAWKACLQAGRYCSHLPPRRGDGALKRLEMQMELLAEALRSCPAVACNQVLSEWMRKEHEVASLLLKDAEEDETHATSALRGLSNISSQQLRGSRPPQEKIHSTALGESEASMGLFAVAAGAAKALTSSVRPSTPSNPSLQPQIIGGSPPQRQRRRDIVGGMVTSGLASGLGWVLGAQPTTGNGK